MYAEIINNKIIQSVDDLAPITTADGTQYPSNWDKSTIPNLIKVVEETRPDGTQFSIINTTVSLINGVPTLTYTTEPVVIQQSPQLSPKPQLLWMDAQRALNISDRTIIRCIENGLTIPQDWKDYRNALRTIISNKTTSGILPILPTYPTGS